MNILTRFSSSAATAGGNSSFSAAPFQTKLSDGDGVRKGGLPATACPAKRTSKEQKNCSRRLATFTVRVNVTPNDGRLDTLSCPPFLTLSP